MKQSIPEDWTVEQTQAAYAIAVCNELLECWGLDDPDADPEDHKEIRRIRTDIACTNGVEETYRLTKLGRYEMCGAMK